MTEFPNSERSHPRRGSEEASQIAELEQRLLRERPIPRAGFRASLRSTLLDAHRERKSARAGVRLRIAAYAGSGVVLLIVAALGVSGLGPLAPG